MMAFMAVIMGLGLLLTYFWGLGTLDASKGLKVLGFQDSGCKV